MLICLIVNMFDLKREYLDYTVNVWRHYLSFTYFHVRAILDASAPVLGNTSVILFPTSFASDTSRINSSFRVSKLSESY